VTERPGLSSGEQEFICCPYCTIQIAAGDVVCPHCKQALPPSGKPAARRARRKENDFRELLRDQVRLESLAELWVRYGKWIKVAGPLLAAFLLLFLVYGVWVGHKVTVVPNPELPIKVKQEKGNRGVLLTVMVTNMGEDVPDLSLKSIGVVVEIVYRDGRREKKTFFPKAEYRGEGALLHGETGSFEIETRPKGLKEVILRSEIVDLGMGRTLIPPGAVRRPPSRRR
jgi:hypothetical protein